MHTWVTELCEREQIEDAKRQFVARNNQPLIQAIKREIDSVLKVYNEKHPVHLAGSAGVAITASQPTPDGGSRWLLNVTKNSAPAGNLKITFPFNTGALQVSSKGTSATYQIDPDKYDAYAEQDPKLVEYVYFVNQDKRHQIPALIEEVLKPLLFPQFS